MTKRSGIIQLALTIGLAGAIVSASFSDTPCFNDREKNVVCPLDATIRRCNSYSADTACVNRYPTTPYTDIFACGGVVGSNTNCVPLKDSNNVNVSHLCYATSICMLDPNSVCVINPNTVVTNQATIYTFTPCPIPVPKGP